MEKLSNPGFVFLIVTLVGFYLAYLYGHKTRKFRWSEYIAIFIWPFLFVIYLAYSYDYKILTMFLVSCFVGTILEFLLGLAYHKTLNKRLWTYDRLGIGGYTSWLSVPMWGIGGVVFWFLGKTLGL